MIASQNQTASVLVASSTEMESDFEELRGDNSAQSLLMPFIYIFFTLTGLIGNALVASMLVRIFLSGTFLHVYVYVCALCAVDFVFLLTGPITVTHMIVGTWVFDSTLCKVMFFCEGMHKSLSIYVLVGLTGDRFLAVCHPLSGAQHRNVRAAGAYVGLSCLALALTNAPLYLYSEISAFDLGEATDNLSSSVCSLNFPSIGVVAGDAPMEPLGNSSILYYESPDLGESGAPERGFASIWTSFGTYYILFMFLCYHLLPGVLILGFTGLIFARLRQQFRANHRRSSTKTRVAKLIFAVVVLYFSCWSPFWVLQMFIRFSGVSPRDNEELVVVATVIYTLPFLHANANAVLYAFLNKSLRQAYKRAHTATNLRQSRARLVPPDRNLAGTNGSTEPLTKATPPVPQSPC